MMTLLSSILSITFDAILLMVGAGLAVGIAYLLPMIGIGRLIALALGLSTGLVPVAYVIGGWSEREKWEQLALQSKLDAAEREIRVRDAAAATEADRRKRAEALASTLRDQLSDMMKEERDEEEASKDKDGCYPKPDYRLGERRAKRLLELGKPVASPP